MSDTNPIHLFVTATSTDCGKTLVAAILCEAYRADYWKPIQTGPPPRDADTVSSLVSYPIRIFPETYLLKEPVSPHLAAKLEGKQIRLADFQLPQTKNHLIVEGAGGLLVPLNERDEYVINLARSFSLEVVLAIKLELGCINHALLSINELKSRKLTIKGLIFNGQDTYGAIDLISHVSGLPTLLHVKEEQQISPATIIYYSNKLQK